MSFGQKYRFLAALPDTRLTAVVRGEGGAEEEIAELYRRHRPVVRAHADACCPDTHTAEHLTFEAFIRTVESVRRGGGPTGSWRPHLLATVEELAADGGMTHGGGDEPALGATVRTDLSPGDEGERGHPDPDPSAEERELLLRGFRLLPERSRSVLWHAVVDGESAAQTGKRLGLTQSGATALRRHARRGLREAYLSFFARSDRSNRKCRNHSGLLAAAVRQPGKPPGRLLSWHLDGCARCRKAFHSLTDLDSRLRSLLPATALPPTGPTAPDGRPAGPPDMAGPEADRTPAPRARPWSGAASLMAGAVRKGLVLAAVLSMVSFGAHLLQRHATGPEGGPSTTPPPGTAAPSQPPGGEREPTAPERPSPGRPSGGAPVTRPPAEPVRELPTGRRTSLEVIGSGQCLRAATTGSATAPAACDGGADQEWQHVIFRGRDVLLRSATSGRCLRDRGGAEGADEQRPCEGTDEGQVWRTEFSETEGSLMVVGAAGGRYVI
ncbi:hypothetical protein [Streptomyces cucumeris]|uniref:hypothetical protein n=1 Tax=Streptomyces cucumeris TaxID=2962890 RepID=UPI0020C844F1|nr:hypothetical protein [Streptomyces sp. NEAU-Y11]MCP9206722.1 hypothetical protein [Streptomyces sp. NEAU-Y11]